MEYSTGRECGTKKKSESPTGIEPMTFRGHFDITDPSSMQDACHHELSKYDLATSLPGAQWLERPTGVWKVMGSIPVGDSDVFFVPRSRHVECSIRNHLFYNQPFSWHRINQNTS